jgi:hypothetical protein
VEGHSNGFAGGDTVVDEENVATFHAGQRKVAAVNRDSTSNLPSLALEDELDSPIGNPERIDRGVVQLVEPPFDDRPDRVLGISGSADFPGDEDIHRDFELSRDFVSDGHAAAGEGEDERIGKSAVAKFIRKRRPRLGPTDEATVAVAIWEPGFHLSGNCNARADARSI